ncbi:MAG: UTRA domain-containing protein [Alphaproteobacteria bacterium]|jgi:GntR family transcriptional regulator|nr:UTRA domain-containing protein [Alphaproteobacteria bacterium]
MTQTDAPGFRPLYQQVRDLLPSEPRLAAELKVSQGTVRKALDDLAAQNLVVRRQGRGTFVAAHSADRSLFHFFQLVGDDGRRRRPDSRLLDCRRGMAGPAEAARLDLAAGALVVRIDRLRLLDGRPAIVERIVVPQALFPGLDAAERRPLPNTLYDLYQRDYGVTVARAAEKLKAVAAGPEEADQLHVARGAPLLEIDRVAFDLDGRPVEWRLSRCPTADIHYAADLA